MKKQLLLAALGLSLLLCSGCTGGKTNGDGSGAGPLPAERGSAALVQGVEEPEGTVEASSGSAAVGEEGELEQLCQAALNYCEYATGHRPGVVRIDSEDEEGITLQLYDDMGDHTATCAWYCIDPSTMEGYDLITGEEIAFYSYMQGAPAHT